MMTQTKNLIDINDET